VCGGEAACLGGVALPLPPGLVCTLVVTTNDSGRQGRQAGRQVGLPVKGGGWMDGWHSLSLSVWRFNGRLTGIRH